MGVHPPVEADIEFASPTGKLYIDRLRDPSGKPCDVLDKDLGFTVSGRVTLPSWLSGKGVIKLAADEIGGQFDEEIGGTTFEVKGGPEGRPVTYPWQFTVNPIPVPRDDKMYQLGLVFVLQTLSGGHTDIGGFYDLGAFLVV